MRCNAEGAGEEREREVTLAATIRRRQVPVCPLLVVVVLRAHLPSLEGPGRDESLMRTSRLNRLDKELGVLQVLLLAEAYLALAIVSVSGRVIC